MPSHKINQNLSNISPTQETKLLINTAGVAGMHFLLIINYLTASVYIDKEGVVNIAHKNTRER